MITVARHLQESDKVGAMNQLLTLWGWFDDTTYLTKTGALGCVYRLTGVDYESSDVADREHIVHRFLVSLRPFDERFRVYQYLNKRRVAPFIAAPCPNPVAADILRVRAADLNSRRETLYLLDLYMVVEIDGPKPRLSTLRSLGREAAFIGQELDQAARRLHHAAHQFETSLDDVIQPTRLHKKEAFQFLQRLVNVDPEVLDAPLVSDEDLDFQLANSGVRYERDHLTIGKQVVKVLTMKAAPMHTFAHVMNDLERIPGEFIACVYWHRQPTGKVRRGLWWRERFYRVKPGLAAKASQEQVGELLKEMELDGRVIGHCSFTLLLHDRQPDTVEDASATAIKVFAHHDAVLAEETAGSACAWLAMVPGNHALNIRADRLQMTDQNLADMSFLFTLNTGSQWSPHLRAPYLAAFETPSGTPYFFTMHLGDVGHTLILGNTGSGKSFLAGFLLLHVQQYGGFTVVLDIGRGYRKLAVALGGSYLELGITPEVKINPFAVDDTPENRHFLRGFVKVLLEGPDRETPLSEREDRDLDKRIAGVYALPRHLRRLDALSLPPHLHRRMSKWVEGGRFPLFDNVEDTFTLDQFQVLDLKMMATYQEILEPMLFYVLHRIQARLGRGFTSIWMDEAWRMIKHPVICEYVRELIKTGRKDNAALILITQRLNDFDGHDLMGDVLQGCQTKFILFDQSLDRPLYAERLHLHDAQLDAITHLRPKKQLYLIRDGNPGVNKVLDLNVDEQSAALYTNDHYLRTS